MSRTQRASAALNELCDLICHEDKSALEEVGPDYFVEDSEEVPSNDSETNSENETFHISTDK